MLAVIYVMCAMCSIIALLLTYLIKQYRFWKNLGIPGPKPTLILGNMSDLYNQKVSELRMMDSWYQEFKTEPYIGFYNLWKPTLFVMDPQLIKAITEVDFDHFTDHPQVCGNSNYDAIMSSLFTMNGALWKSKRKNFSPLFAPKNLKEYSEIMNYHSTSLLGDIGAHSKLGEEIPLEEIARSYMIKSLSHILYSLDLSKNEEIFSKMSHLSKLFERPPSATTLLSTMFTVAPRLFENLGVSTYSPEFWDFFSVFTKHMLESRNEVEIGREDLVSLIAQLQKEGSIKTGKTGLRESVSHIFSFYTAGINSNLTTLTYAIFQLSRHPEVQEKLRHEVDNVLPGKEGVTYASVMKMQYLKDVINETLRIFPRGGMTFGAVILKRTCTIPYKLNDNFTIPKGMDVVFSVYSLQMDPKYFPAPEEFKPERFSESEKPSPVFMPFGKGPRTCIGKRLAYISVMIALAQIISNYRILPSPNTDFPDKFDPRSDILTSLDLEKFKVLMQKREKPCLN